jgi:hypothetical protein
LRRMRMNSLMLEFTTFLSSQYFKVWVTKTSL